MSSGKFRGVGGRSRIIIKLFFNSKEDAILVLASSLCVCLYLGCLEFAAGSTTAGKKGTPAGTGMRHPGTRVLVWRDSKNHIRHPGTPVVYGSAESLRARVAATCPRQAFRSPSAQGRLLHAPPAPPPNPSSRAAKVLGRGIAAALQPPPHQQHWTSFPELGSK